MLQIPMINLARKVETKDGSVLVEKLCDGGYKVVKAHMPVLVTVSSEAGELRYPNVRALVDAKKRPVKILNAADLELDPQRLMGRTIVSLAAFNGERRCTFAEGETPEDKAASLVALIRKDGIL
jgi:electron transfer flavoprotein beta subunit